MELGIIIFIRKVPILVYPYNNTLNFGILLVPCSVLRTPLKGGMVDNSHSFVLRASHSALRNENYQLKLSALRFASSLPFGKGEAG
jgi:hypothetical protein